MMQQEYSCIKPSPFHLLQSKAVLCVQTSAALLPLPITEGWRLWEEVDRGWKPQGIRGGQRITADKQRTCKSQNVKLYFSFPC